jgi:rhodanese-related sulfurtransferase/DNA-binding transcriptional ArsR family regulator
MAASAMSSDPGKQRLYQALGRVGAALSSGPRLALLEYAAQRERSVEALAAMTGLSVANASKHLQALRQAGLVTARREGLRVYYALAGDDVSRLLAALREVAERRAADVEKLLRDWLAHRDALEPVPARELLARAKKGLVTVLDVRPEEEYAAGHLPGAINVPLERLERALARLPRRREVVAYCRGPYCLMSFEAVAKLRKRGFRARRLENGFPEWRAAGLPVER